MFAAHEGNLSPFKTQGEPTHVPIQLKAKTYIHIDGRQQCSYLSAVFTCLLVHKGKFIWFTPEKRPAPVKMYITFISIDLVSPLSNVIRLPTNQSLAKRVRENARKMVIS